MSNCVRFRWSDVGGILLFGAAFLLFDVFVLQHRHIYVVSWASFLGMGSLVVMGLRAIWSEGEERRLILLAFIPYLVLRGPFQRIAYHWVARKAAA